MRQTCSQPIARDHFGPLELCGRPATSVVRPAGGASGRRPVCLHCAVRLKACYGQAVVLEPLGREKE